MVFGLRWWLRPDERADVGTPVLVVVQAVLAASSLAELAVDDGALRIGLPLGALFALLTVRNCLRLLRPRPVARTGMVVSLAACGLLMTLSTLGPLLDAAGRWHGALLAAPTACVLTALAREVTDLADLKRA